MGNTIRISRKLVYKNIWRLGEKIRHIRVNVEDPPWHFELWLKKVLNYNFRVTLNENGYKIQVMS